LTLVARRDGGPGTIVAAERFLSGKPFFSHWRPK
jgi:hypothetical protein